MVRIQFKESFTSVDQEISEKRWLSLESARRTMQITVQHHQKMDQDGIKSLSN